MKLLIITQKVDKNDPILGFFVRWVQEFAKHCEKVTVICLEKGLPREIEQSSNFSERKIISQGSYDLPENVKVLSLGKEKYFREEVRPLGGAKRRKRSLLEEKIFSRVLYTFRFYCLIYSERKNYDTVFVHMNQEYVILGWKFWKLFNKKIFLWRNHYKGSFFTRLAVLFSNKVFCTSKYSYTAKFKKTKIMPVGIDTDFFKPNNFVEKIKNSIFFLGRIDPVKNVDIFIKALHILDKENVDFIANIYGDSSDKHKKYYDNIRKQSADLEAKRKLIFHKSVINTQTPFIYSQNEFFVNATDSGSFDKTILEAMACGVLPIVSNKSLTNIISKELIFEENNPSDLSEKIKYAISLSEQAKKEIMLKLRDFVIKNHTLKILVSRLFADKNEF